MANLFDVDDWVENAASLPVKRFYPSAVASATGLPLSKVFQRLLYLVQGDILVLLYEIRCPEYECMRTVKTLADLPESDISVVCSIHGEFECPPNMIFPVFEFNPEYKVQIKSKKKVKNRLALRPVMMS